MGIGGHELRHLLGSKGYRRDSLLGENHVVPLIPGGTFGKARPPAEGFPDRVPLGYENDGTPVDPYVYPVKGSGGLLATVEDIARFAAAEMTGEYYGPPADRVLSMESIRALHTPQVEIPGIFGVVVDSYGFGHFSETLPDGRRALWHGGQGHG